MKKCTKCNKSMPIEQFSFRSKPKGIRMSSCKACQAKYHKVWYKNNIKLVIERTSKSNLKYAKRNQEFVNSYKASKGCQKCGERCPIALDLHHTDSKKIGISKMTRSAFSIDTIKSEINKCIVICSNCHRKLHAGLISI